MTASVVLHSLGIERVAPGLAAGQEIYLRVAELSRLLLLPCPCECVVALSYGRITFQCIGSGYRIVVRIASS